MNEFPNLKDTAACMRAIRNILGSTRIYELSGIKTSQLSRYCRDPENDAGGDSCKDIFQKSITLTSEIGNQGYKDLEFAILSMLVAPAGYKLVPLVPEDSKRKESTLAACLAATKALVDLQTAMCSFEGAGVVAAHGKKTHEAIDYSISKWMKAAQDKETPRKAALNKVFEKESEFNEE